MLKLFFVEKCGNKKVEIYAVMDLKIVKRPLLYNFFYKAYYT
jgi:hypothetical protein